MNEFAEFEYDRAVSRFYGYLVGLRGAARELRAMKLSEPQRSLVAKTKLWEIERVYASFASDPGAISHTPEYIYRANRLARMNTFPPESLSEEENKERDSLKRWWKFVEE